MRGAGVRLLDQPLFHSVLTRERKRTERTDRPFLLLLVEGGAATQAASSPLWGSVIDAVAAAKDETAVLGWFRRGHTLGMIVPDCAADDVTSQRLALEGGIRYELARRVTGRLADIVVRVEAHPKTAAVSPPPLTASEAVKRAVDILGSVTLLALLAPLLLLIAALVKLLSPGPVLFKQVRIGYLNHPFTMLKFRTMHVHADEKVHLAFVTSFIAGNGGGPPPTASAVFKLVNDPRVTPVGRLLRKTSLDELPQLWNVLRGDMSLVGPRPPIPYEIAQYKGWHWRRILEAKPGITGLWQVTGRSRTTFDDMVRLDLRYARTRSLWTDIKILLATPRAVISGQGAS
jgi:lipopolysaccharide/colanic/teichoic acid biosynthesis glycosyltransferase